ncbi:LytR C-terminal domain-containing protein [Xylanimonas sp. McL0601]|uniref:LytR C-terminal domain-containing protein n=1 Tax=Xylanimonas sp. McL0601 TaxID=3414739 RepID=UPI003CF84CA7
MSRSQYPYPPDEFDVRGPDDAPVGVHRAPRSRWSSVWPFLLVAIVAVAVAVAGVTFLSRDTGTAGGAATTAQSQPTGGASADATDPAAGGDDAAASEPPAAETPAADDGSKAAAAPDVAALVAAANTGAQIRVLNDSGINGEAKKGTDALAAQGFTNAAAETFSGSSSPDVTSVWYAADRSDTAAAVAAILGIPAENVSQQTLAKGDVVVIIKSALTPAG